MLEAVSGPKVREAMPLDFLAIGRRFKLSTHQTQRLWERLIEDPRYHLALHPGRWLRAEFRREAAALVTVAPVERSKAEPDLPWLGGGGYFATDVGKQTLVELELQRRGGYLATDVGKQALVEVELQRRGGYPITEVGKQTLVEFERLRSSTGVDQRRLVEELLGRGAPQALVAEEPTVDEPTVDEPAVEAPAVTEQPVVDQPKVADEASALMDAPALRDPSGEIGASERSSSEVQDVAAQGVAGSGGAMPHREAIASSFGPEFDISGLRAHIGGAAASAADALGAEAYAHGNDIAFSSAPDVRTAAHEATHAVLQQRGIAPAGGVGAKHDALERQRMTLPTPSLPGSLLPRC